MKIKNTFNTGKMNKDVDERLIPNGEFIDASNIRVLNTAGSDAGAIENEKGNVKLTNLALSNNPECIGSIADEAEEKIYWFIVNDDGFSYIYEYDRTNQIVSRVLADERIGDEQVLGFNKDYKITGINIFYNIPKKEKLLVFTDDLNHPRCVNINRAKGYGLNNFYEEDINLYKKPPYEAPTVVPTNSLQVQENTVKERFFAFAYRYKYLDGEFSALSSFSNYQFVPSDFELDFNTHVNEGMVNVFNSYQIKYNTGDKRVTDIQICFKTSNDSNIYIAESINKKDSSFLNNATKTFVFINKKIYKQLPPDEVTRIFDNVPLKAQAQDIIEDRVVFGNYTIQYDLKENESDEDFIRISYSSSLDAQSQDGNELTSSFPSTTQMTIDLTDVELKEGYTLFFNPSLESAEAGTSPDEYFGGEYEGTNAVVLSQTYSSVSDFAASDDLTTLLAAASNNFEAIVTTTPPPDNISAQYGDFALASSTSTSITISAPTITHTIDDTPGIPDDDVTSDEVETFTYNETNSVAALKEKTSNSSIKSLKSYEVGLVYLDKHGRYSSVIPSISEVGKSNEVFVSVENSVTLNSFKVEVNSKPPYWADRYKFFVKAAKSEHYNIYATVFYEENLFRWILLEGGNLGKVEKGDFIICKADDNGPMQREVKVKVLDVTTKNAADNVPDDGSEGWINGNVDADNEPIVELPGTYMKIKPIGFTMDYNPYNFQTYHRNKYVKSFKSGRTMVAYVPSEPETDNRGIGMYFADNQWNYLEFQPGSRIKLKFEHWEGMDSNNDDYRYYEKEFLVGGSYETDDDGSAFEKWWDAETEWYYDAASNWWLEPTEQFRVRFNNRGSFAGGNFRQNIRLEARGVYKGYFESARLIGDIKLQLTSGVTIFETVQKEDDSEVFYETEQTFKIENGLHKGNEQDQTATDPAICSLSYFNCFAYENGAESISVRDDRFAYRLGYDYRPNIILQQGYKELNVTHGLIHSGSFNENSGYNALNEFNSSRGITKNLDTKYGSIQKLFSRERDLIVFQEDRVSKVLYGKTILSSPDGTGSLSQIEKVLGQDVPFSGEYGISTDPESFAYFEGRMYFTDANRGAVLRLGGDGISPISYQGMKAFFKRELYGNKGNWNIGGFDPKFHQYVLTMGSEQKPADPLELDCASSFIRTITSAFNYDLNLGSFPGTATIAYTTSSSIDIVIVYNGNTYTNSGLTGTGSVTFPVTSTDLETANVADVTITPASSAQVTITHTCPEPETLEVILVVVNDSTEAGQSIINRFKHDGASGGAYSSDLDVFDSDELTRYEVLSGFMGTDIIPNNGDTITLSSLRQIGVHTGEFNDCNSLGYLVSAAGNLTVQNIIDQATYPSVTGQTLSNGDEENTMSFTFNRSNTSQKLYLVWNYIDTLPVLVDDSVTGITNGGSTTINVVANDTIPSPYTITIGTQPTNGTAVVNADNTITYTHTAEADLDDSFTYIVDRGGTCTAEATVTTQALAISVDTYIYIYFDSSGSMDNTEVELNTMRTGALKSTLQDLYATGLTESEEIAQGLTPNPATNGSDEYDDKVTIVYAGLPDSQQWADEETFAALSDNDVNDFKSTGTHNAFPSDASNVIIMVFQDEASPIYHDSRNSDSFSAINDGTNGNYDADIADLRSRVSSLNSSNSGFYRGVVFQVEDSQGSPNYPFKAFLLAVEGGATNYSGTDGLSDLMTGSTPTFVFEYDIEDSTNDDTTAPFKPGSTTDRFDQWQYYYLYWVTNALNTLGFTPNGVTWPVIEDDD